MAHNQHNKSRRNGGFFLIILGALIFIIAPTYMTHTPELGLVAIIFGFVVGGTGFYITFIRGRKVEP